MKAIVCVRMIVAGTLFVAGAPFVGSDRAAVLVAQGEAAVSGVVLDVQTRQPLANAQVMVEGTNQVVLADARGRFRIPVRPGAEVTLRVAFIGYRSLAQNVQAGATDVQFALQPAAVALDEVVVTGTPGATQVRAIGNAIGKIAASSVVEEGVATNLQSVLSARVAGVDIGASTGNVGTGGMIRVRGVGSISLSNEPLLYVDGVRVDNNPAAGPTGMREPRKVSRVNDFNPEDIESIEIIKGPAAATLYGTEASRGVIQIITKKGRSGAPKFDVTVRQGYNFFMNPGGRLPKGYRIDRGQTLPLTGKAGDLLVERKNGLLIWSLYEQEKARGTDIFSYGPAQGYAGNLSGGTEQLQYYLSADHERNQGYINYNWQNKGTGRISLNTVLRDNLTLDATVGYMQGKIRFAQAASPYGVWDAVTWGHAERTNNRGWYTTPGEEIEKIETYSDLNRTTWSVQTKWSPFPWLAQRLTVGNDASDEVNSRFFPQQPEGASHYFGSLALGDKRLEDVKSTYNTVDYATSGTLNASSTVKLVTSVGAQYYTKRRHVTESNGRIFPSSDVNQVGGAAVTFAFEDLIENKTFGMFFQESVEWRNKVFFTGAVRGDDNSAFGKNFDFIVYPKLSASWVVNEESFWPVDWVNTLKLRGAWGQAGQQPDVFAAIRLYEPTTGPGDQAAFRPYNIGNPDLKPERGTEVELGFDAGVFSDRLGLNFTWYNQSVADAIIERPLPLSLGFPGAQFVNLGKIRNWGMELGLDASLLTGRTLGWDLAATVARNQNKVISMGGVAPIITQFQQIMEGQPIGVYTRVEIVSADLDPNDYARSSNVMCAQPSGPPLPCSQSAPRLMVGRQTPLWEGSVKSKFTLFRNLSLSGTVDYKLDYWRADGDVGFAHSLIGNSQAIVGYEDGRPPDPIARAYFNLSPGNWGWAMFMHKAGFARLREFSGSYAFPVAWARKFRASRMSLAVAGRNLWFLWRAQKDIYRRPIIDPEAQGSRGLLAGQTQSTIPLAASLIATLRVSF